MSRTVSARIPKELHEELRERCNKIGCSINDYLQASIEFGLTGHTEFDFGEEEDEDEPDEVFPPESEPPELKPKEISKLSNVKISYDDGKTWYDEKGNEVKVKPKATIRV